MANRIKRQRIADRQKRQERQFRATIQENQRTKRLFKTPHKVLDAIYNGSITTHILSTGNGGYGRLLQLFNNIRHNKRPALYSFFKTIVEQGGSRLLISRNHVNALYNIYREMQHAIRPLDTWRVSKSRNLDKFFGTLIRHLFVRYEMPNFMDKAWTTNNDLHIGWYIYIGEGNNFRTANGLPLKVSKKMAHFFMKAPNSLSIMQALRWAQVCALGGSTNLALSAVNTRISEVFNAENFWISVIRLLVDYQETLELHQANPIIDFVYSKKFLRRRGQNANEVLPPEQPHLSMKGRTLNTLLAAVEQWHIDIVRTPQLYQYIGDRAVADNQAENHVQEYWINNKDWWKMYSKKWTSFGVRQFLYVEGTDKNRKTYTIRHLKSAEALAAEGKTMSHCVGSYAYRCESKKCAIFTLKVNAVKSNQQPLATIEIRSDKTIVQVRSLRNQSPSRLARQIIRLWAFENDLNISCYTME